MKGAGKVEGSHDGKGEDQMNMDFREKIPRKLNGRKRTFEKLNNKIYKINFRYVTESSPLQPQKTRQNREKSNNVDFVNFQSLFDISVKGSSN